MKKSLFIFWVTSIFFVSCRSNDEIGNLKKENAALVEQVNALKSGNNAKAPKYILKLRLKQSHISLSIKKHVKDAMNAIDFEIPVDKEFFDSVSKGTEIVDKFRFGSFVLTGSFGDWEMIVKDKVVR